MITEYRSNVRGKLLDFRIMAEHTDLEPVLFSRLEMRQMRQYKKAMY